MIQLGVLFSYSSVHYMFRGIFFFAQFLLNFAGDRNGFCSSFVMLFQWSMSFRAKCFIRFSLWKQHYFQFSSTNKIITENNVVEFFSSLFCTLNRNQIAGVCVYEWLALFRWIYIKINIECYIAKLTECGQSIERNADLTGK